MTDVSTLPRLVYIGDVPVEASYHGSALLYRILENYPTDRLLIVEMGPTYSVDSRRLTGRSYVQIADRFARISSSRFNRWYNVGRMIIAGRSNRRLIKRVSTFEPDIVITVSHGASWLSAALIAERFRVPLHLICHDDWPTLAPFPRFLRGWLGARFSQVYRQSASRLCVSPAMAEAYRARYGTNGAVLYPSRSLNAVRFTSAAPVAVRPLTVAFAGSQFLDEDFRLVSSALAEFNGELLVFGPFSGVDLTFRNLDQTNVRLAGMLDSTRLLEALRRDADVLFVPVSFDEKAWQFSAYSFPSKLADYTQTGLPLLIFGPAESSSVQWALANDGIAVCVTVKKREALVEALRMLEPLHVRQRYGAAALEAGEKYFSHEAADRVFKQAILAEDSTHPSLRCREM